MEIEIEFRNWFGIDPAQRIDEPGGRLLAPAQALLGHREAGDEVRVAQGTYTPTLTLNKTINVSGGYDDANWSASPDPLLNETILDGENVRRVVHIQGNASPTIESIATIAIKFLS